MNPSILINQRITAGPKNPVGASFPNPKGSILIQPEVINPILKKISHVKDLWKCLSQPYGILQLFEDPP